MIKTVVHNITIGPEELKRIIIKTLEDKGLLPPIADRYDFAINATITREQTFYNVTWHEKRPANV